MIPSDAVSSSAIAVASPSFVFTSSTPRAPYSPGRFLRLVLVALLLVAPIHRAAAQANGVLREVFYNIPGTSVTDLTGAPAYPNNPDEAFIAAEFEAPSNFADFYGQRMRALITAPTTGSYVFWISGDDGCALYLSTDENPANRALIATVSGWTSVREWTKEPNQRSVAISLIAGRRYFIEALQKEGGGGDNLAVRWQIPGGTIEEPIPNNRVIPFGIGAPVVSQQPTNVSVVEGGTAVFSFKLESFLGSSYRWQRGGTDIPGATNVSYSFGPVALGDNGSTFRCFITNAYGGTNTTVATLTVTADVTKPFVASVGSLGDPQALTVVFSEPVEAASALNPANYAINNGVTVTGAAFGTDPRTVVLTTSPMAPKIVYTLNIANVRDRASTPNTMLASQRTFSLDSTPLDISFLRPGAEPPGPSTRHGPIVVSEIMYHPTNRVDGKDLEFVELFNSSAYPEDISGYRLSGEIAYTFPAGTVMPSRTYRAVAAVPADLQSVYGVTLPAYTGKLSNGGGAVRLLGRQGQVLFETTYGTEAPWPVAADGAGHSLVLARPSYGEDSPNAWSASERPGGSPGSAEIPAANPYRTVVINEFLAHTDLPDVDFIELYNYGTAPVDLSGCILSDDPVQNRFVIPANTVLQPQAFLSYTQTQLGFALSAAGETIFFKTPSDGRVLEAVRFGAQENGVSTGRFPDGAARFSRLSTKTPGQPNGRIRVPDVVLNEIMYAPVSRDPDDTYVELHNRTAAPVNVGKWRLEDGITYTIPAGTTIPANGFLVVAKNTARLLTNYPGLTGANTLGDFSGNLARSGERVALSMPDEIATTNAANQTVTNTIHIVVDEVTYGTGGRWGQWSKDGGSSLERIDPRSDGRLAPNWADSDESAKSSWTTLEATGVLDNGTVQADSLQVLLMGPGECLVDNVEVFVVGQGNRIANSTFESGFNGWFAQGNHDDSGLDTTQGFASGRSLHLRTTGRGDTGANRVRTALTTPLNSGQTVTIRAKVRWLAGHPEILLRLRGGWLEATMNMVTTRALGTPGAPNSRFRTNAGPAITDVTHSPALPAAGQAVTVVARVQDPDGLASLLLKYRVDPSTNLTLVPMVNNGAGLYSATIPGQAGGALAAFQIEALDNGSPKATTTFPDDAPLRECLVRWGEPAQGGTFGTYRFWMTAANFNRWSTREKLSNKPVDCTFVLGNYRVIYNIGGQYSGSPYHAPGFNTPTGNVCDYVLNFPEDETLLGETDFTLQWPGNGGGDNTYQREQTAYWLGEQIGIPYCYRRHVNLFVNGVRRAEFFEDAQQPNGDMSDEFYPDGQNGDLHKIQLWFEFDDSATSFTTTGATLQNFTTTGGQKKVARYRFNFAKRAVKGSTADFSKLFALVDAVNVNGLGADYRRTLESQLDVDNWLRTYAVEHIVGNNDSFAYGGGQNMFTYKPTGDTWKLFIWDIDFAFNSQSATSDPFQGIGRSNGIDLNEPAYRRRYWEILQDLANGPLVAANAAALVDSKYAAMIANGRSVDSPEGIKSYIGQRRAFLLSQIAANTASTFALTLNGGNAFSTNRNLITLTGNAPVSVRSITVNGVNVPLTWTSVSAWTALVSLDGGVNTLQVQGLDASGNPVGGASATLSVTYTGAVELPQDKLVIHEIMYHPAQPGTSFVEIRNTSANNSFDLSGWKLDGADFTFPSGSVIAAGAYVVVVDDPAAFALAYGATIPVAGQFKGTLQNNGETLRLIRPGATPAQDLVVDEVRYDSSAPWPAAADGGGSSLQLVDASRDNNRVGSWAAVEDSSAPQGPQWRYVSVTGTASSSTLYVYLLSAGDAYIDDLKIVPGTVAEAGVNSVQNGDFEGAFPGAWNISPNSSGSIRDTATKHSGNAAFHLVATSGGTSQGTAVWQDLSPGLTADAPCTLSFWYRENTNGGSLRIRLSGSGVVATVNLAPGSVPVLTHVTPGAANSVAASLPLLPPVWLNEIQPDNQSGATDRFGHRHPWAEIYNGGSNALALTGLYLANNYSNLTQWPFPAGASVPARGFLTVWLDGNAGESIASEPHTSFTVPSSNGSLALVQVAGGKTNILDYLNYKVPQADRSYGSSPDGSVTGRRVFYYATPGATNNAASPPLNVLVNEWMADNATTLADPADGDFEDWFELYNPTDSVADLSGFYLGTSLTNKTKFKIPAGYTIPARGRLLVWADNETGQNATNRADLHVNFKLSKSGEAIGVFAEDGTVVDFVVFGAQTTDATEGRFPDGSATIMALTTPTPRTGNFVAQPNTAPQVGALPARTVFEGQQLVFTATATDADLPAQILVFSLDPGAPTNATINASSGLFSWRPLPSQTPGTNTLVVRATDNGTPPLSGTAQFVVRVVPRPQVSSIATEGSGYAITFVAVPGKTYRLDYKNSLDDPEWKPVDAPVAAVSGTLTVNDNLGGSPQRFYRIVALD